MKHLIKKLSQQIKQQPSISSQQKVTFLKVAAGLIQLKNMVNFDNNYKYLIKFLDSK